MKEAELDWPSLYRCFGTWGYALNRANAEAKTRKMRVYLFRGELNGRPVWVTSLDPKPAAASAAADESSRLLRERVENALAVPAGVEISCGGYSVFSAGCFTRKLALRVQAALDDDTGPA